MKKVELTGRQLSILRKLFDEGTQMRVRRVEKTQFALALELGITRQALSNHLRKFRELGMLSSGRGFIDISEKAELFLTNRDASRRPSRILDERTD